MAKIAKLSHQWILLRSTAKTIAYGSSVYATLTQLNEIFLT